MATVTAALVVLSFVSGCVTLVVGYRLGHGTMTLVAHLGWAMATLLLQFAAACIAVVHARAERRYVAALEEALQRAGSGVETQGPA
jgi:hypothetical protein